MLAHRHVQRSSVSTSQLQDYRITMPRFFMWILESRIQVLILTRHILCQLSHLPNPDCGPMETLMTLRKCHTEHQHQLGELLLLHPNLTPKDHVLMLVSSGVTYVSCLPTVLYWIILKIQSHCVAQADNHLMIILA